MQSGEIYVTLDYGANGSTERMIVREKEQSEESINICLRYRKNMNNIEELGRFKACVSQENINVMQEHEILIQMRSYLSDSKDWH